MAKQQFKRRMVWVATTTAFLLIGTACGGSSGGAGNNDAGSGEISADVPALDALFEGGDKRPPVESPPPAKGMDVWWISCGQQSPSCAYYAEAGQAAAEAIGWDFHIADGNLGIEGGYSNAVRTALAADPDAIVVNSFACDQARQPLEEAKAQGVLVIGATANDCTASDGPELFSVDMVYGETMEDTPAYWRAIGEASASYVIRVTDGQAKLIENVGEGDPQFEMLNEGFQDQFAKCGTCEVVDTVNFTIADLSPNGPWINALRASLVKNPDANVVYGPFDILWATAGGAQAVRESGFKGATVGGLGNPETMDLIRDGALTGTGSARDGAWLSWAAIDNLNRAFNDEPSVPQGIGLTAVDQEHNLPKEAGQSYTSSVDFRAAYMEAWGS